MPDLVLWNCERGEAKLVEVKSKTDKLSLDQKAWLASLTAANIPVEVSKVLKVQ